MKPARAVVLLNSGRRLDLLDPHPDAWTDRDLAIGLSRTYRWAGYSAWDLPLSVAQHSLAVLTLRERDGQLTAREALRELLHDATEALFGGFDPLSPIKPHLGEAFRALDARLQDAVDRRYALPAWSSEDYACHKRADRLAAASEALHVVGWSRADIRSCLALELDPLAEDPLVPPDGMKPWEPWPPKLAASMFLDRLTILLHKAHRDETLSSIARAYSDLAPKARARCRYPPNSPTHTNMLVYVEARALSSMASAPTTAPSSSTPNSPSSPSTTTPAES